MPRAQPRDLSPSPSPVPAARRSGGSSGWQRALGASGIGSEVGINAVPTNAGSPFGGSAAATSGSGSGSSSSWAGSGTVSPSVTPSPGRAHRAREAGGLSGATGSSRVRSLPTVRAAIKGALLGFLVVGSLVAMASADWQCKDHLLSAGIPAPLVAEIRALDANEAQARLMEFEAQIGNGAGGPSGSLPSPDAGSGSDGDGYGTDQDQ